jgi:hypothetical protein
MKYGKELKNILSKYNPFIQNLCISYKKWKKWRPKCNYNWKYEIFMDCIKANYSPKELWDINLKTLYKICKRLNKKYNIDTENYYIYIVKSSLFKFTQKAKLTII